MTSNIGQIRAALYRGLGSVGEADRLLCYVLGHPRSHLYSRPEKPVTAAHERQLLQLLEQRCSGVPTAYLTGYHEFFSLRFKISRATWIPRPETEMLVEYVLQHAEPDASVLELGTGSGAAAVAVARHRPDVKLTATDIDSDALNVAEDNACTHKTDNVEFIRSDWYEALRERQIFDMIITNPPYVGEQDADLDPAVAAHEPKTALFAGSEGLDCLRIIIRHAPARLRHGGVIAVEHGCRQGQAVAAMMTRAGLTDVRHLKDAAELPRVCTARKEVLPQSCS